MARTARRSSSGVRWPRCSSDLGSPGRSSLWLRRRASNSLSSTHVTTPSSGPPKTGSIIALSSGALSRNVVQRIPPCSRAASGGSCHASGSHRGHDRRTAQAPAPAEACWALTSTSAQGVLPRPEPFVPRTGRRARVGCACRGRRTGVGALLCVGGVRSGASAHWARTGTGHAGWARRDGRASRYRSPRSPDMGYPENMVWWRAESVE